MSNPLVSVQSAIYGNPEIANAVIDVTAAVQRLFDRQYADDNRLTAFFLREIGPHLFDVADPAPDRVKTFTIGYVLTGAGPARRLTLGGRDRDTLKLTVAPLGGTVVVAAFYGARNFGLDLTKALGDYLADPGNSTRFLVGGAEFWRRFCGGRDPAPTLRKFFSLTFRHSPVGHDIHLCGYDGQTIDAANDSVPPNETWMEDLAETVPSFRSFPLRKICLPATHDSGTYSLQAQFTKDPDRAWIKRTMDAIDHVNEKINIPGIGHFINPASWAYDGVMGVTRSFARATHTHVLQQLRDGIRCFDLRIYFNRRDPRNPFYTYHTLVGAPLAEILSEVAFFISALAPGGEIVYLTLGHYQDDNAPGSGFTPEIIEQLTTLIWSRFPNRNRVFGPQDAQDAGRGESLLDCTYGDIVGSGPAAASKVILVIQKPPAADRGKLWSTAQYSPPDSGGESRFIGAYKNTDDFGVMLVDQKNNSIRAKSADLPFALYLTLTPQTSTVTVLTVTSLRNAVLVLLAWAALVPFIGWALLVPLGALAVYLAALIAGETAKYSSLKALASHIFSSANPTLMALIRNHLSGPTFADPSFIYMDFYEDSTTPNGAGQKVAQIVEVAKSICMGPS